MPQRFWILLSRYRNSTIGRSATATLFIQIGGLGTGFLAQVMLARWMDAEAYGIYTYAISISVLLALFGSFGFPTAMLRFIPLYQNRQDPDRLRGLLRLSQGMIWIGGSFLAALGMSVLMLVNEGAMAQALMIGIWASVPVAIINLQGEALRALKQFRSAFGLRLIVRPLLILGGAYLLWRYGHLNPRNALAVFIGSALYIVVWQAFRLRSSTRPLGARQGKQPLYEPRHWLKVAGTLMIVEGLRMLLVRTDLLFIGLLRPASEVGLYNAAMQTAHFLLLLTAAVDAVAAPALAATYDRAERAEFQRLVTRMARWYFWPTLLALVPLGLSARFILSLYGEEFVAAQGVTFILGTGLVVNAAVGPVKHLLNVTGHERDSVRVLLWVCLLNAVLNVGAIYFFGAIGAAVATTVCFLIRDFWIQALIIKRLGIYPAFWHRAPTSPSPQ